MTENMNNLAKLIDSQRITEKNSNSSTKSIKLNKSPSESINSRKDILNKSFEKRLESIQE